MCDRNGGMLGGSPFFGGYEGGGLMANYQSGNTIAVGVSVVAILAVLILLLPMLVDTISFSKTFTHIAIFALAVYVSSIELKPT